MQYKTALALRSKITGIIFLIALVDPPCSTNSAELAPAAPHQNRILQPPESDLFADTLKIPPRSVHARSGSQFMNDVENVSFEEREEQIFNEISRGNIPGFLRQLVTIQTEFADSNGTMHTVQYQVMPDYLCLGSDEDFCRVPTGPITAQRLADLFGAILPTRRQVAAPALSGIAKAHRHLTENPGIVKFVPANLQPAPQFIPAGVSPGNTGCVYFSAWCLTDQQNPHLSAQGNHWSRRMRQIFPAQGT